MMKAVFLDRSTIDETIDFAQLLDCLDELKSYAMTKISQVAERAAGYEVIITNKVVLSDEHFSQLPDLKLICITATGTDNVDIKAAKNRGITVTNVANYSTQSVAQHVFAYLLSWFNNIESYQQLNQQSPWSQSQNFCQFAAPINELSGKTLGVLGYGNLGRRVANIATAFGMEVLISERAGISEVRQGRVCFDDMLEQSDIVSVHCPLCPQTEKLFTQEVFSKMKKGSVFINTARGGVVDAAALAETLKSKHLGYAIIDVLEVEPPELSHPLLAKDIPNLVLTHHIAWGSLQAQQRLMDGVAKNIRDFI